MGPGRNFLRAFQHYMMRVNRIYLGVFGMGGAFEHGQGAAGWLAIERRERSHNPHPLRPERDPDTSLCSRVCHPSVFAINRQAFLAPGVKEARVRQSLIDPLFEALGWDVGNRAMTAPQYREVIPEDSLDVVEGSRKHRTTRFGSAPCRSFTPRQRSAV